MRKMKLWKIVSAFVMAAVLVTGCGGGTSSAGSQKDSAAEAEVTEENTADEAGEAQDQAAADKQADAAAKEPAETETLADTGAEENSPESLNSGLEAPAASGQVDCSFELEGKKYTLPIPVSELLADGYYLDEDLNTEIGGLTYTWCDLSKEEDSYDTLTIYIFNGSGNTKALSDCVVSSIEVNDSELENYSFALGNGLKPGDLPETVEQIMGAPTDQYDSDLSLTYYYGEDRETGQIQFSWPKENGELTGSSDVSVSYFPVEKTSTSAEVPEYLSEYTAPSAMGEDFDSGTLTLDGVIYQLPCPVSEFVKNGWTVDRDDEVMADRLGSITLKKGDIPLSVYVYNFANYQTIGSNCAVTKILCSDYSDTVPIPDITLPKGLTLKTDLSTMDSIIGSSSVEFSRDDDSDSITYMYSDYDLGTSLYISYDKGTSMIDAIHYGKDIWP